MMKLFTSIFLLSLFTTLSYAQIQDLNRFSLEPSFGLNSISKPLTTGYSMKSLNAFSANISMRYMMTRMVGISMEFGMSKYASDVSNFSFESRQLRASAQLVLNVAQVAKFSRKTNHLGLLVHGGLGLSSLNDDSYNIGNVVDNMAHVVVGITPQVKLTERFALQFDYSLYGNMLQNKTFDLQSNVLGSGIKGFQSNWMIGIMLVLGDKSRHSDWYENR